MARTSSTVSTRAAQLSNAAPVPRRSSSGDAAAGTAALPAALQSNLQALSGLALGDVQVHSGSSLPARYGALAITQGNAIHLGPGQAQHLAHEAWHVVQQRQGRVAATLPARAGLAPVNDDAALEAEADVMGQRALLAARSAPPAHTAPAHTAPPALPAHGTVQRFTPTVRKTRDWRLADDSSMAVRQDSPVYGGRYFYANSSLISASDAVLKSQKSALQLTAGGTLAFNSPATGAEFHLTRVVPTNRIDGSTGNERASGMQWQQDCGFAANTVMQGGGRNTKAVYQLPEAKGSAWFWTKLKALKRRTIAGIKETPTVDYGTVYDTHRGVDFYSPHKMLDDVLADALQMGPKAAWAAYQALSAADKDGFDRSVGLNQYATPDVGEAYSIVANKDEVIDQGVWNFHWGGVVMKSGGDTVTLENFAGSGATAWDFQMYGPAAKPGQTFHEQQASRTKADGVTPEYGDHPTTLHVRPVP